MKFFEQMREQEVLGQGPRPLPPLVVEPENQTLQLLGGLTMLLAEFVDMVCWVDVLAITDMFLGNGLKVLIVS